MTHRKTLAPTIALAALLAVPATGSAALVHFKGKATGPKPDKNMRITFDVKTAKGRPVIIKNVHVTKLDYRCENGYSTEQDLRFTKNGKFTKKNRFEITEKEPPPSYFNDIYGRFLFPKKGVRKKPTVKGSLSSEFGYGPTRNSYNCLCAEQFTATRAG